MTVHIIGYIAKKLLAQRKYLCCKNYLIGVLSESNPDHDYIRRLSRGGLTIPSSELTEYVCAAFSILEYTERIIVSSELPAHRAASVLLNHVFDENSGSTPRFTCGYTNRVLIKISFNNRRKELTGSVVEDKLLSGLKRSKRAKE